MWQMPILQIKDCRYIVILQKRHAYTSSTALQRQQLNEINSIEHLGKTRLNFWC